MLLANGFGGFLWMVLAIPAPRVADPQGTVLQVIAAGARIAGAEAQVLNRPHEVLVGGLTIQASDPQVAMFALVGPRKP